LYLEIEEDPSNPNVSKWKEQLKKSEIRVQNMKELVLSVSSR
jgi:hypothetical protein